MIRQKSNKKDFFISYNHKDEEAARWIAWHLEKENYTIIIQAWDFLPGNNFVEKMDNALKTCKSTIAVLSNHYIQSGFTKAEWQSAFAKDPTGEKRALIPVRIKPCDLSGLLGQIIYIDLVGLNEEEAKKKLLEGVKPTRPKPKSIPPFKGFKTRDGILKKRKLELNEVLEKTINHNYHMTLNLEVEIEKEIMIEYEETEKIEKKKELVWEEVELEKILTEKKNYILINPSGMGKTTFLIYIACTLLNHCQNYPFLPLLVTCIEINKRGTAASLHDFIKRSLESFYYNSKTSVIENEWENVCILIDALDQARDVDDIASSLHLQNKYSNYKKAKIIISSRQNTAGKIKEGFNKIRLKLPEDNEVRNYLRENHYNNLKLLIDSSKELITVPVLLEMLNITAEKGHILSKIYNRTCLYDEFTRILIDQERNKPRYWQDSALVKDFINYDLEKSMEKIAFFSLANNEILEIGKDKIINYCESPEKKEALLNTGIILELFEDWEHQLVFRHQSFQAYFAARYIHYQQTEYFKQLIGNIAFFYSEVWYEVLRFYIGLEKNPQKAEEIINSIYQRRNKKDILNNSLRLIFAFFLMSETRVSNEKIEDLYSQLNDLLVNNKVYLEFIEANIDKFNMSNTDQREKINILIESMFHDDFGRIRSLATKVLGKIGTSKDLPLLEPLLKDDEWEVQNAATKALGKIVTSKEILLLKPFLRDDNRRVRSAASEVLNDIVTLKEIPLLETMLRDGNRGVRSAASEVLNKIVTPINIQWIEPMHKDGNCSFSRIGIEILGIVWTPKDIPLLEPLLRDGNRNVRSAATKALGKLGTTKDLPLLEPLLTDDDWKVRSAAIEALGELGTPKDLPLLEPLLRDGNKNVRSAATKALGKLGTPKELLILESLLMDDDWKVRSAATEVLRELGTSKDLPLLEPMLRDDEWKVRSAAAEVLGKIVTSKETPLLEPLLSDDKSDVRIAAAEALLNLGTSKDLPLSELLLRDDNWGVQRVWFKFLAKIGSTKDIHLLEPMLMDEDVFVLIYATKALGEIGTVNEIHLLRPLLRHYNGDVLNVATKALVKIITPKDISLLEPLLRDGVDNEREAATYALSKIITSNDIQLLEPMLRDDDVNIRKSAAEALIEIVTPKDLPLLEPLLRDDNKDIRKYTTEALIKIVTPKDLPLLEPLLRDDNKDVRRYAAEALIEIVTPKDLPILEPFLRDDNEYIRKVATETFGKIGKSQNVPMLELLLNDYNWDVRKAAAEATENIYKRSNPELLIKEIKEKKKELTSWQDDGYRNK